jgi:hypothetical protein
MADNTHPPSILDHALRARTALPLLIALALVPTLFNLAGEGFYISVASRILILRWPLPA